MYLAELYNFYERMAEDPDSGMPPEGMSSELISFALVIDAKGNLAGEPQDLRDSKRGKPIRMFVPATVQRSGTHVVSNFLWDNTGYVLGIDANGQLDNGHKREAFQKFHRTLLDGCDDPHAKALLAFLEQWTPDMLERLACREALPGSNVIFRLEGESGWLHQQKALKDRWMVYLEGAEAVKDICLITGRPGKIALTHPFIKGVAGGQSSGTALISFNLPAFTSFAKKQNANAPVCASAARSYTSALNYLLQRAHRQMVRIGDTSIVFWAEKATPAETLFGEWFDLEPVAVPPQDREQVNRLKGILTALRKGQSLNGAAEELDGAVRFFVLGLAPSAARLSVRFWLADTLDVLLRHIARWYEDLHIERQYPDSESEYPALWLLLVRTIAALGKSKNIPPELAGKLAHCVLAGRRFPESVYAACLQRIRADKKVDYYRAALLKAYFCRNGKQGGENMETLNADENNIGYRLGRLFALLEKAQRDALGDINAPLRERYIGAASATPRVVFPMLLRLAQHHVTKAKKENDAGYEAFFSKKLEEITAGMLDFPAVLSLQDQGRFMLGYYHQNNTFFQKKNTSEDTGE